MPARRCPSWADSRPKAAVRALHRKTAQDYWTKREERMNRCESCDREIPEGQEGMGYCFGGRPEYLCLKCCPPGDAETIINSIKAFMASKSGGVRDL